MAQKDQPVALLSISSAANIKPRSSTLIQFDYYYILRMYFANDKEFQIKETWGQDNKKNPKKPPVAKPQQQQNQILKDAASKALNYPQITHDILDQHTANLILKDLNMPKHDSVEQMLNQHKIRNASPVIQKKVQDNDLVGSMASRLGQLEKLCNNQKLELREKSQQIDYLNEQINELKKYQNKDQSEVIESLKEENKKSKEKIQAMEAFLKEYGIKWVGDEKASIQKMKQLVNDVSQPKPYFNYHLPKEISIDVITRRIEELNYIMEKEGGSEIVKDANGVHKFKKLEALPIGFYKNGISMKGFKFFSYGSNDSYQILADILEGYFPYQLKRQYPNGTPLKVIDRTDEIYEADKLLDQKQVDVHSVDEQQLRPQTKQEFLDKLPKNVIKNGKVIPIRSEIAKKFEVNLDDQENKFVKFGCKKDQVEGNWIVTTQAQKKLDEGEQFEENQLCTLKFRTETGKFTLIALMFSNQRIKDIYECVEHLREFPDKKIEIMLNFPRTVFSASDMLTLEEAGLLPSAQLFFKSV